MKKVLSIFLLCIMSFTLASCSSNSSVTISKKFNENFSIRNGITFGMSKDEVIKIEKATLESYEQIYENYSGYPGIATYGDLYNKYHTLLVKCKVLNEEFQNIYYYFDDDKRLIDFGYELDENDFEYYYKLLKDKYGNPLDDKICDYIYGIDYSPLIDSIPAYNFPSSHTVYGHSVYWIVQYKDCIVLIELNDGINQEDRILGDKSVCFIGYKKTTLEAIEQGISEAKEHEKKIENNIHSDI